MAEGAMAGFAGGRAGACDCGGRLAVAGFWVLESDFMNSVSAGIYGTKLRQGQMPMKKIRLSKATCSFKT
jgi:hypothetical protein